MLSEHVGFALGVRKKSQIYGASAFRQRRRKINVTLTGEYISWNATIIRQLRQMRLLFSPAYETDIPTPPTKVKPSWFIHNVSLACDNSPKLSTSLDFNRRESKQRLTSKMPATVIAAGRGGGGNFKFRVKKLDQPLADPCPAASEPEKPLLW